jgi:hypothetical protein
MTGQPEGKENKMKVGDLVRLSAYGRQRKRAEWIGHADIGLITKVVIYNGTNGSWPNDYIVHWTQSEWSRTRSWGFERSNTRRDLVYVK